MLFYRRRIGRTTVVQPAEIVGDAGATHDLSIARNSPYPIIGTPFSHKVRCNCSLRAGEFCRCTKGRHQLPANLSVSPDDTPDQSRKWL
jgi:hypothetical protein